MKQKNIKHFKVLFLTALLMSLIFAFAGCGKEAVENKVFSADDLPGNNIGVQLGTTGDIYLSDYEDDGSGTIITRFNKGADAIQSLKQGKIDAVVIDSQPAKSFVKKNSDLEILPDAFTDEQYAMAVSKTNTALKQKLDDSINALLADGTIQTIIDHYIGDNADEASYVSDPNVSHSNGTITMATNAYFAPYEYYDNGNIKGIDVDIMTAVCDKLGMTLKIEDMEFDSVITAVQSGKVDVGVCGMTITEDRLKNIDFTVPYTTAQQVIIVRNGNTVSGASFTDKLHEDFVTDNRYQYVIAGLKNTLIITVCAALIGIVLGFLVAVIRSTYDKTGKLKIGNFICNLYLTIIRGTPTMVQLLIIYYVIFGSINVNKIIVAILAFGINSGAYVAEIFRSGIMSIDKGQFEAASSLGLSYKDTMMLVILPQAFKNVLPALANEFIVLLKETSISGYIGLNDLTRGGDIIRSITYDAMLPLLFVALIYLVIVMILSSLVKKLERRLRNNER